ncbi:MAG: citrate/2-methylcitrate synthase, partial [Microbacterium sp.]
MTDQDIKKGLAGVVADVTAISKVNPETNSLLYRGYPVQELAATQSFEAVAYLLWSGELPNAEQLTEFQRRERALRALDPRTVALLDLIPVEAHPMDVVRTVVSQLGTFDDTLHQAGGWTDPDLDLGRALYLFAQLPTVVAAVQRRRRGLAPIAPRDDLDYSENFLWMTFGELPSATAVDVFRVSMVLYAEHSFNASTFTARVIASTTSDLYSAVVGAIGALKGPLHGGANEAVMHIFDEIGEASNVVPWLDDALANKKKIMGFGHRVYKKGDSRVPTMKAALDRLIAESGRTDLAELYARLEDEFVTRKG